MAFKFPKSQSAEGSRAGSIDSMEDLLHQKYKDIDTEDPRIQDHHELSTRKGIDHLVIWRIALDVLVLVGLGLVIALIRQRVDMASRPECVQHHLPVGSDLSGFVPSGKRFKHLIINQI